jgi:hypothetical protein
MRGEDIFENTNGKCHVFTFLVCKRKIFLSIVMASVICVHFSQVVDHCVTWHAPHNTIEHTHAKILVSTLERPSVMSVLIVKLLIIKCNLGYGSK